MTANNQLTVSEASEKNSINLELVKAGINYQQLLQKCENIAFSKDSINQDYAPLKELREVIGKIKKIENPYYKQYQSHIDAKKSILNPLEEILKRKTEEYASLCAEIKLENEQIAKENKRKADIRVKIDTSLLDYSNDIAACTSERQLLEVERKLNLDLTRKNVYYEFLDYFKTRSEAIRGLITAQKKIVKSLEGLKNEYIKVVETGSDEKLLEIEETKELLNLEMDQNRINVMETAAIQTQSFTPIEQLTIAAPKARRTSWDYEVKDESTAYRWGMLRTEIDPKKAKESLALLKENGSLKNKKELVYNGIRFFLKETF